LHYFIDFVNSGPEERGEEREGIEEEEEVKGKRREEERKRRVGILFPHENKILLTL
jgi:hypothetical protein